MNPTSLVDRSYIILTSISFELYVGTQRNLIRRSVRLTAKIQQTEERVFEKLQRSTNSIGVRGSGNPILEMKFRLVKSKVWE